MNIDPEKMNIDSIKPENINTDSKICDKCNKEFSSKSYLAKHKDKCKGPINALKCNYCSKEFKHPQNKYAHQKICKEKLNVTNNLHLENSNNNTINANTNIDNSVNTTNNDNSVNIVNNYNFSEATYIGLSSEQATKHMLQGISGICNAIDFIYFNEKLPSLIELHVDRTKIVKIRENGLWNFESLDNAVNHMKNKSIKEVCSKADMTEINETIETFQNNNDDKVPEILTNYYQFSSPDKAGIKKIKKHTLDKLYVKKYNKK